MTPVSELLAVKIELVTLKLQQLLNEQQALLAQARADVDAPVGHIYDLTTRTFHPPPKRAKA